MAYTPMIMADSFKASRKARDIDFTTCNDDRPLIVQFASKDSIELADVSELVYKHCDGIDLNCGCPQRWAMQEGYGSAMLKSPELIADMVRAVRNRLPSAPTESNPRGFSVSIKIRFYGSGGGGGGGDTQQQPTADSVRRTIELCRRAEACGVDWITLHCRTPAERAQPAHWAALGEVAASLHHCPLVLNGDVDSWDAAMTAYQLTKCPGMMSARGLLANPALFSPPPEPVTLESTLSAAPQTPLICARRWLELTALHGLPLTLSLRHLYYMLEGRLSRADRRLLHALSSQAALFDFVQTRFPDDRF